MSRSISFLTFLLPVIVLSLWGRPAGAIQIKTEMGMGIRGNGDSIAAHWGGMARLVEEYGAYGTMAGGSSASISIFLYESSLLNPHVTCSEQELADSPGCERERLSFLIKSFEGIMTSMPDAVDIADLKNIYSTAKNIGAGLNELYCRTPSQLGWSDLDRMRKLAADSENLIRSAVQSKSNPLLQDLPNWEMLKSIRQELANIPWNPTPEQFRRVQRLLSHLKKSFEVFGKFDARSDEALFVRPGVVNFKGLTGVIDRVANLLAGRGLELDSTLAADFKSYVTECSKGTIGKEWATISNFSSPSASGKKCGELLHDIVIKYNHLLKANKGNISLRENDLPGETLPAFTPILSTAVVEDEATIKNWSLAQQNFIKGEKEDKWNWRPDFNQVKFGYWVKKDMQATVRENLRKICEEQKDYKSCKGMIIGNHSWKSILSLSPAEPGLSRAQLFEEVLKDDPQAKGSPRLLSLGGWSDLIPQKILKAAGAKTQTLVTRRGYDTYFGQGVMIRLGVNDLTHDELSFLQQRDGATAPSESGFSHADGSLTDSPENPKKRTQGDWARGYNLHNPESSFNQSLLEAAAVLCTHWDGGSISDWKTLIRDSYNSILYVKDEASFPRPQSESFLPVKEGETPADLTKESGARYLPVGASDLGPDHPWFNRGCNAIQKYYKDLPVHQSPFHPVGEHLTSASFGEEH